MRLLTFVALGAVVLLASSGGFAAPPRCDAQGDPLPEGAFARLGTARFRPATHVYSIAFAPDGKLLAATGHNRVFLWEANSGRLLRSWPHSYGYKTAFTRDGKGLLVMGSGGDQTRIYDVTTEKEFRQAIARGPSAQKYALSADQTRLLAADPHGTDISLWDLDTGRELRSWIAHEKRVAEVCLSPDGATAVSTGDEYEVRVWDTATGKERYRLAGKELQLDEPAISPDGKLLALGGNQTVITLHDLPTCKELRRLKGHRWTITTLVFSPRGDLLASGSGDGVIGLWDVATGKNLHLFKAHPITIGALAFSADGRRLASSGDRLIRVWDVATGKGMTDSTAPGGEVLRFAFAPDSKELAVQAEDGTLRFWDLAPLKERRCLRGDIGYASTLTYSPDGRQFLWAKEHLHLGKIGPGEDPTASPGVFYHSEFQHRAVFSRDGKFFYSGGSNASVLVWEVATGKIVREVKNLSSPVAALAVSGDDRYLVTGGSSEGRVVVYDLKADKVLYQLPRTPNWNQYVRHLDLSPDGRRALMIPGDSGPVLWDLATGEYGLRLEKGEWCYTARFSPDGRMIVTDNPYGSSDGKVRLWEVATGKLRCTFEGHRGPVKSVAFSPDGRLLVSGGTDTSVLLWDLTGQVKHGTLARKDISAADRDTLWKDLASDDGEIGYDAVLRLAVVVPRIASFLEERLRPVERKYLDRLIADLDDDAVAVREKATAALETLAESAEAALRAALKSGLPSVEARTRARAVLATIEPYHKGRPSRHRVRLLRGLEGLERNGGAEARQLLESLARQSGDAWLARQAKEARERMTER